MRRLLKVRALNLSARLQDWAFYSGIPLARRHNSALAGLLGRAFFAALPSVAKDKNSLRQFVDSLQPVSPLRRSRTPRANRENLPKIDILVAAVEKDFAILKLTIEAAILSSQNPVSSVRVVVPTKSVADAEEALSAIAEVTAEEIFLPSELVIAASRFDQIGRTGWVTQQLIGLYGAWSSKSPGVLVLDSDTLLVGERVWLTESGVQPLSFSYEYHQPYESHASRVWGKRRSNHFLSFVTHFMLMQPDIVRQMFPTLEDLVRWADMSDLGEFSGLADYHSYGRWISDNRPRRIRFERWSNIPSNFEQSDGSTKGRIERLLKEHPDALSFSSHSWARNPRKKS